MSSHGLPEPVEGVLSSISQSLEEVLQADSHRVLLAIRHHRAFDETYIESALTRALLCYAAKALTGPTFGTIQLPRGGVEFYVSHEGIERRFRLRSARRDRRGFLDVRSSSDSVLYAKARVLELWDDPYAVVAPDSPEPWVLAFRINRETLTFAEVSAARIVGVGAAGPPYRLQFDDVLPIDFGLPTPPSFPSDEDTLEWEDDDEGKEAGGAEGVG